MPLFLILLLVPLIEIGLFIQVGGWLGLWPTLAIVVLTAVAGTLLLRRQGLQTLVRLQASLERGEDPLGPLAHGVLILVAGCLLLTPGFFTDALALGLMLPGVRQSVIRMGAARLAGRVVMARGFGRAAPGPGPAAGPGAGRPPQGETIEGEFVVVDSPASRDRRDRGGGSGWTRPPDGGGAR